MSDFSEAVNTGANQIAHMQGVAQANNAWSASQALIQREWQEQQNAKAMAFNQNEAAKNRNWQEMLSNTAHQREVRDLMAAGLICYKRKVSQIFSGFLYCIFFVINLTATLWRSLHFEELFIGFPVAFHRLVF